MRARLIVSLVLAGCTLSHGLPMDGSVEAGACLALPATVESMRCELDPSGEGLAVITTSPSQCCGSGTVTSSVSVTSSGFDVALAWNACDCCAACRCVGPIREVRVSLGRLPAGRHEVRSHGSSCVLTVPDPSTCRPITADEAFLATVLFDDQAFATTVRGPSAGCGCTPRLPAASSLDLRMEVCDCCEDCECVDPGYEVGFTGTPLPPGRHMVIVPHGAREIEVTTRDQCVPWTPTSLRLVSPDASRRLGGEQLTWAVIGGVQQLCCVPPAPAVSEGIGPAGERALSLHSCVREDCACVGEPVAFEAWHSLGELSSGTHLVRAGSFEASVVVP